MILLDAPLVEINPFHDDVVNARVLFAGHAFFVIEKHGVDLLTDIYGVEFPRALCYGFVFPVHEVFQRKLNASLLELPITHEIIHKVVEETIGRHWRLRGVSAEAVGGKAVGNGIH